MECAMQMAGGVGEAGELRSQIDSSPATLPIKAAHCQKISVFVDISADGEGPALAYSRHLKDEFSLQPEAGKIRSLDGIASGGIESGWPKLSVINNPARPHFHHIKRFSWRGYKCDLGAVQRVSHLVHFDRRRWRVGCASQKARR